MQDAGARIGGVQLVDCTLSNHTCASGRFHTNPPVVWLLRVNRRTL